MTGMYSLPWDQVLVMSRFFLAIVKTGNEENQFGPAGLRKPPGSHERGIRTVPV